MDLFPMRNLGLPDGPVTMTRHAVSMHTAYLVGQAFRANDDIEALAEKFNLHPSTVGKIIRGEDWTGDVIAPPTQKTLEMK